jgi:hypothetical protein
MRDSWVTSRKAIPNTGVENQFPGSTFLTLYIKIYEQMAALIRSVRQPVYASLFFFA